MSSNRDWMYTKRLTSNGSFNPEFQYYVTYFLDFAFTHATNIRSKTINGDVVSEIRCPCSKCENFYYKTRVLVEGDLCINGFMANYYIWDAHGELYEEQDIGQFSNTPVSPQHVGQCSNPVPSQHVGQCSNPVTAHDIVYDDMVIESMYQSHAPYYDQEPQDPNQTAETFFTMLKQANEPLWDGCKKASVLSTITRLLNWKAECNVSDSAFDRLLPIIKDCLPDGEKLPRNFYDTKKILKPLELPTHRIHVCKNHCALFDKEKSDMDHCPVCKESRYKPDGKKVPNLFVTYNPIGPRLQRLFYAKMIARHLTWHSDHPIQEGKMTHPSEGSAWKHFDTVFPDFAQETRNIRIGLGADGFSPNNSTSSSHSCWPVFVSVYNLPPWLAFKQQYIQIPLLIPGKKSPGQNIDVFLQPLVDELKMLFSEGIDTYDAYRRNNFRLRVVLLWTVSDFPAYGMLSGWSTHGKLACPYCSDKSGSFRLKSGSKPCWFDGHRKYLPKNHSFRKDKVNFLKNKTVRGNKIPIPAPTSDEIWQTVQHITTVYQGTPVTKPIVVHPKPNPVKETPTTAMLNNDLGKAPSPGHSSVGGGGSRGRRSRGGGLRGRGSRGGSNARRRLVHGVARNTNEDNHGDEDVDITPQDSNASDSYGGSRGGSVRRSRSQLSQLPPNARRKLGHGVAGSTSAVGRQDPMADMHGVFQHITPNGSGITPNRSGISGGHGEEEPVVRDEDVDP